MRFVAEDELREDTCYRTPDVPLWKVLVSRRPMRKEGCDLEETLAVLCTMLDPQPKALENQQSTVDKTNSKLEQLSTQSATQSENLTAAINTPTETIRSINTRGPRLFLYPNRNRDATVREIMTCLPPKSDNRGIRPMQIVSTVDKWGNPREIAQTRPYRAI